MVRLQQYMPTEGQFIALWTYNNLVWSYTMRYDTGTLQRFDPNNNNWVDQPMYPNSTGLDYIGFIVL